MENTWRLDDIFNIFWKDFDKISIELAIYYEKIYNELELDKKDEFNVLFSNGYNGLINFIKCIEKVNIKFSLSNDFESKKQTLLEKGYQLPIVNAVILEFYGRFEIIKDIINKNTDVDKVGNIDDLSLDKLEIEYNLIKSCIQFDNTIDVDFKCPDAYLGIIKNSKKRMEINSPIFYSNNINYSLKAELKNYGFYNLPKIKALPPLNRDKLMHLICTQNLPYCIAMFSLLDYINYLNHEYFDTLTATKLEIAKWFETNLREIDGQINALKPNSKMNRYKSFEFKEKVIIDYNRLKSSTMP